MWGQWLGLESSRGKLEAFPKPSASCLLSQKTWEYPARTKGWESKEEMQQCAADNTGFHSVFLTEIRFSLSLPVESGADRFLSACLGACLFKTLPNFCFILWNARYHEGLGRLSLFDLSLTDLGKALTASLAFYNCVQDRRKGQGLRNLVSSSGSLEATEQEKTHGFISRRCWKSL